MSQQIINTGTANNAKNGDPLRTAFTKVNSNFAELYSGVQNTTLVTGPTYTVTSSDYYIGVNYAGPVTITLLPSPANGNQIVIKDESGRASAYPITLVGTIDNNTNIILAVNNGALTLIYNSGWRLI